MGWDKGNKGADAREANGHTGTKRRLTRALALPLCLLAAAMPAQQAAPQTAQQTAEQTEDARLRALEQRVERLQTELNEMKTLLAAERSHAAGSAPVQPVVVAAAPEAAAPAPAPASTAAPAVSPAVAVSTAPAAATVAAAPAPPALVLPNGSTLNLFVDTYLGYNTNQPVGRVNYLHPYDVLDDVFGLNQAGVMYELLPDLNAGRRYGLRLDLQFGQATATLQGSNANEARPDIYRNLFQAYGRYVVPVGKGLTVDVGKWASSLGYEGNYTRDQMEYSRSYFFDFLPFYHMGLRANYAFNSKFAVNYWMVNGTNQTEPTNSFKDEMFGFVATPAKNVTWTSNYYLGQENPDTTPATNCSIPTQPGLCFAAVNPAPDGRTHIFDNYVSWQATPKLLLGGEVDYFISRQWRTAAPGHSSAPSHNDGGAVYAQWQFNPKSSLNLRGEYMSDRNGLFSNTSQALKEGTLAYKYSFADGFTGFLEYRHDWSNRPYFLRGPNDTAVSHQDVFTLGMVWTYGGKQGSW